MVLLEPWEWKGNRNLDGKESVWSADFEDSSLFFCASQASAGDSV